LTVLIRFNDNSVSGLLLGHPVRSGMSSYRNHIVHTLLKSKSAAAKDKTYSIKKLKRTPWLNYVPGSVNCQVYSLYIAYSWKF